MPGFNPFRYRFPYTNINDINLDWIIKKVRKLSEDVATLDPERMEEIAQQAAEAEQTAQDALETAEGVSGIASDAETIARAAQTTANNAADSAQAAGTAAAAAQTTANNAADSAQAAGTAAAAAQTTANQNRVAIAIVANGDVAPQSILEGQYVIWHGGLYKATTAIAADVPLTSSNLQIVTGGGLNDLLNNIVPIAHGGTGQTGVATYNIVGDILDLDSIDSNLIMVNNVDLVQWGKVVQFRLQVTAVQAISANTALAKLKTEYRPKMPTALYEIANRNSGYISFTSGDIIINNAMAEGVGRGLLATWILS